MGNNINKNRAWMEISLWMPSMKRITTTAASVNLSGPDRQIMAVDPPRALPEASRRSIAGRFHSFSMEAYVSIPG